MSIITENFLNDRVTQHVGDVRAVLKTMPADHFDCVVTSPPYFGLRDYGTAQWSGGDPGCDHKRVSPGMASIGKSTLGPNRDGVSGQKTNGHQQEGFKQRCGKCGAVRVDRQIGLEQTPDAYVAELVAVFREVRRVLRPDGTVWLNLGDSYATGAGKVGDRPGGGAQGDRSRDIAAMTPANRMPQLGLKPKDLCGIPWRVAFALQDDGWWLRQDIIWSKPNPMPESVTDRCTKAHEYIFLMSKAERYYYDADAIAEGLATDPKENYPARARITGRGEQGAADARGGDRDQSGGFPPRKPRASGNKTHKGVTEYENSESEEHRTKAGLLKISETAYLTRNKRSVWTVATSPYSEAHFATFPPALIEPCILAGCPVGGRVLDPFGGAGTTGLVAATLGRTATLIELNPEYAVMARARIEAEFMGREEGSRHMVKQLGKTAPPGPLFAAE